MLLGPWFVQEASQAIVVATDPWMLLQVKRPKAFNLGAAEPVICQQRTLNKGVFRTV